MITKYVKEFNEVVYHTCFEVDDLDEAVDALNAHGRALCVNDAKPAVLFGDRAVAFYYIVDVGLVEILLSGNDSLSGS